MEAVMDPSTVQKYNQWYNEGYDISSDELYTVWTQLKELWICGKYSETTKGTSTKTCTSKSSEDMNSLSREVYSTLEKAHFKFKLLCLLLLKRF